MFFFPESLCWCPLLTGKVREGLAPDLVSFTPEVHWVPHFTVARSCLRESNTVLPPLGWAGAGAAFFLPYSSSSPSLFQILGTTWLSLNRIPMSPGVLVCSGCYNKMPQIGLLIKYRNVFHTVLEAERSRWEHVWLRVLFWVTDFLLYLMWQSGQGALWGLSHSISDLTDGASPLWPDIAVSTSEATRLGLQYGNLGRTNIQTIGPCKWVYSLYSRWGNTLGSTPNPPSA